MVRSSLHNYHHYCHITNGHFSVKRYPLLYLWYLSMHGSLTQKDHDDLRAVLNPDILHMIRISAIGLQVIYMLTTSLGNNHL